MHKDVYKYKIKKTFTCCPVKYFRFKKYTRILSSMHDKEVPWPGKGFWVQPPAKTDYFLKTILVKMSPSKLSFIRD